MLQTESTIPLKSLLFFFHGANAILISFLPIYLEFVGLKGSEIGWVMAIGPMSSIIAQPFWGYMSDKYQTVKRMVLICLGGLLLSTLVFFQMTALATILIMAAIFYFFVSPIGALSDSLAQRKSVQLGVNFGSIRTWGSIGFAVSALIFGEILGRVGIQHIMWPYFSFGIIAFISCLFLTDVKVEKDVSIQLSDVKQLLQNKPLIIFLVLIMFITITHRASDSFLGLYITRIGGSEGLVGLSWFIGVASEAAVFAFAGLWFKKYHPLIFIIGAGILYSTRWFIYSFISDPIIITGFQFLHGLSFGVFYLAAFDYVSRLIPTSLQATGHLLFVTVFFGVSGIFGSLFGGFLIDSYGGGMMYFILGWSSLIGVILLTVYHILPYGKEITPLKQKG
ncbi:MFS transporter [Bacillaceae bacterium S4-13-58]